jgi:hypothetical protein
MRTAYMFFHFLLCILMSWVAYPTALLLPKIWFVIKKLRNICNLVLIFGPGYGLRIGS